MPELRHTIGDILLPEPRFATHTYTSLLISSSNAFRHYSTISIRKGVFIRNQQSFFFGVAYWILVIRRTCESSLMACNICGSHINI